VTQTAELAQPKTEAEKAMERLVGKVLARLSAVDRTKAAMDGEVTDETPARHAAWRSAVDAWNLLPYELGPDHRMITKQLAAELAASRQAKEDTTP
jgi:hypothetical protein